MKKITAVLATGCLFLIPTLTNATPFIQDTPYRDQIATAVEKSAHADDLDRPSRVLREGDTGPDVIWVQQRLSDLGFPVNQSFQEAVGLFGTDMVEQVKAFQSSAGLDPDGIVGDTTVVALAGQPGVSSKLTLWSQQLEEITTRYRDRGYDKVIVVNIPTFTLHAINLKGEPDGQSKVIVGTPRTKTPIFETNIINLKANPDWSPPPSIKGARYQRPGPNNALGLMRFSTDNRLNIFLHDTNNRQMFERSDRALSHGCIRVQSWRDLALWLSGNDEQWLDEVALKNGTTRYIDIEDVPVVTTYSLVDVVDGSVVIGNDIYRLNP